MRSSVQANSLSGLVLTKLDVLDEFESIRICTGYRCEGKILKEPPFDQRLLSICEPVYEEWSGWQEPTFGIADYQRMPKKAREYIQRIEELTQVPIKIISTRP